MTPHQPIMGSVTPTALELLGHIGETMPEVAEHLGKLARAKAVSTQVETSTIKSLAKQQYGESLQWAKIEAAISSYDKLKARQAEIEFKSQFGTDMI